LLAGERAHYEIAAHNHEFALELLRTMARQTSQGGMIPSKFGMWTIFQRSSSLMGTRPVLGCRWFGRIVSTSSSCGRYTPVSSGIFQRKQ
jgi:hypothetical protein